MTRDLLSLRSPFLTRRRLLGASLGAGAVLGLTSGLAGRLRAQPAAPSAPSPEEVLRDPVGPVLGNPDGDVTIVEWFDYQCPYCKAGHPMLMDIVASDGNIRLAMKDWPIFGPTSERATRLALGAVEFGSYSQVHAALMATEGRLSEEDVDELVAGAGVAPAEAAAAYDVHAQTWDGFVARNFAQAEAFGFMGTPSYIVGTTIFAGMIDEATLREAIAAARQA